ncbi:MAG: hypothetical protein WBA48_03480 [Xanthobacteraceae bacterium]
MGFTPQEVDRMSVWQYAAAVEGFNRANAADGGNKLSDAEKAELSEWILSAPTAVRGLLSIVYSWDGRDFAPVRTVSFEIGG